jgi:hypothetical protein
VTVHPIKAKQTDVPDERVGLVKALAEAKRHRSNLVQVSEMRSRTEECLARAAAKLETATAAIEAAKTADCDDAIRKGGKAIGIAGVKATRAHATDCEDEFAVAQAAHARVQEEVRAAAEAVASADSNIFTERNKILSALGKQIVDEGNDLRRRLHIRTTLLNTLLTVAAEDPQFDNQISDTLRVKFNAERSAAIADTRELIKNFMTTRPGAADQPAADEAAKKLRQQLGKLIENPNAEVAIEEK